MRIASDRNYWLNPTNLVTGEIFPVTRYLNKFLEDRLVGLSSLATFVGQLGVFTP